MVQSLYDHYHRGRLDHGQGNIAREETRCVMTSLTLPSFSFEPMKSLLARGKEWLMEDFQTFTKGLHSFEPLSDGEEGRKYSPWSSEMLKFATC